MLNQGSAAGHVEDLQTTADGEQGQIAIESVANERALDFVALVVGVFGFRVWELAIERGVDIGTAHEKQAREAVQLKSRLGEESDRFESGGARGGFVRLHFGGVTEWNQHTFRKWHQARVSSIG